MKQTIQSIKSLKSVGYEKIFILDNSGSRWCYERSIFPNDVKMKIFNHYQFKNKRISEIYMILSFIKEIPKKTPIVKLSGRYKVSKKK
jgi:hypothetical protein